MDWPALARTIKAESNLKNRLSMIRKAWELADKEKEYELQIQYRLSYMEEIAFQSDVMECYIIFPEILKIYDTYLAEYGVALRTDTILWKYKWLLEDATNFYQISVIQFERLWDDCKKRYLQNGYSLRPLYIYRVHFYMNIDVAEADHAYEEFLNCTRDSMSDCHACERAMEIIYFLNKDDISNALRCGQAIFDGEMTCSEQPECSYGHMFRFYIKKILEGEGDYILPAEELCKQLKRTIERKGTAHDFKADILLFYSMEHPEKALDYYKKNLVYFESIKNPKNRYWYAMGAIAFFTNLADKESYKMELSSSFSLYRSDNEYCIKDMMDYYEKMAVDIVQKFDLRNGTDVMSSSFKRMLGKIKARQGMK